MLLCSENFMTMYTASKLILNEETMSFINNCTRPLREPVIKQDKNEVVLLPSNVENESTLNSAPVWVTHGRHKLTDIF